MYQLITDVRFETLFCMVQRLITYEGILPKCGGLTFILNNLDIHITKLSLWDHHHFFIFIFILISFNTIY